MKNMNDPYVNILLEMIRYTSIVLNVYVQICFLMLACLILRSFVDVKSVC